MNKLPPTLAQALGRWHTRDATRNLVAALEAHGQRVQVVRLQLGDMRAEGFGTKRVVYTSPAAESETEHG